MNKNLEKKIEDIQNYFKGKILSGDFEEVQSTRHEWWIKVDNKFDFIFWVANGVECFNQYYGTDEGANHHYNFIKLTFTENEAQVVWKARIEKKEEYFNKIRDEAEKAQYERLKKKFNN